MLNAPEYPGSVAPINTQKNPFVKGSKASTITRIAGGLDFRPKAGKTKARQRFNRCGYNRKQSPRFEDNPSALEKVQVLVVHHRPEVLNTMAALFRKFGYRVTKACDSAKALLYFGRNHCDLLFTDLDMPVLDGYNLTCLIKRRNPSTRAVIITCRCHAEVVHFMDNDTVDGWLFKPFKLKQFNHTLTNIGLLPQSCKGDINR